jgi:hypothetical protein
MRYVVWLLILWPLICCQRCDQTWACVVLSFCISLLLHIVLSILHQLRALAAMGRHERWPH